MIENSNQIDRKREFVDSLKWIDWRSSETAWFRSRQPRLKSLWLLSWLQFHRFSLHCHEMVAPPLCPSTPISYPAEENISFFNRDTKSWVLLLWTSLGNVNQPWVTCVTRTVGLYELVLTLLAPWKESYEKPRQYIKNRDIILPIKVHLVKAMVDFSSCHVWMWELDCKEVWALKNWCFSSVMLEKTLESPLDCKEIKPVNPKGNQSWIFIGRTDYVAEAPILWPLDAKSWLVEKYPDAGKD